MADRKRQIHHLKAWAIDKESLDQIQIEANTEAIAGFGFYFQACLNRLAEKVPKMMGQTLHSERRVLVGRFVHLQTRSELQVLLYSQ